MAEHAICWTIAGSDSGGGAGIQADLITMQQLGVHGCSITTAYTAQNTQAVTHVETPSMDHLEAEWLALKDDLPPTALKIGMIGSNTVLNWLLDKLPTLHCIKILDPVMVSSSGAALTGDSLTPFQFKALFNRVDLVTPNLKEAEAILDRPITHTAAMEQAAKDLHKLGAKAVLLKGGHTQAHHGYAQDVFYDGQQLFWLNSPWVESTQTHGTGCTLSAAIAATMAQGYSMTDAVVIAKAYVNQGLQQAPQIGKGSGPLYHGPWPTSEIYLPWITPTAEAGRHRLIFNPMDNTLLGVYPIVDSAHRLPELIEGGVQMAQLRIKSNTCNVTVESLADDIAHGIQTCRQTATTLFINDHWQLALEFGAQAVHLGQDDLAHADLDALAQAGISLGVSTHCYTEVARALSLRPSYIAIGPIHSTTTKKMPWIPQGVDGFTRWRETLATTPLVAIGGLFLDNAQPVIEAGANAVAVVRDLAQTEHISARLAAWQQLFETYSPFASPVQARAASRC